MPMANTHFLQLTGANLLWKALRTAKLGKELLGSGIGATSRSICYARLPSLQNRIQLYAGERWHSSAASAAETLANHCLEVDFDGRLHQFNVTWLRENCLCSDCFYGSTWQKNILVHKLGKIVIESGSVRITGDKLRLIWSDGHASEYSLPSLVQNNDGDCNGKHDQFLWNSNTLPAAAIEAVPFQEFVNEDEPMKTVLSNLLRYGFALVSSAPSSVDSTEQAATRICPVQQTLFGSMWTFTSDMSRADTAYTNMALGAHTDTSYFNEPAGIQMFHCLHHDGEAGETLLVDGFHAANHLKQTESMIFDFLCRQHLYHEYKEPGYHLRSVDTALKLSPLTGNLIRVRYNHYDRAALAAMDPRDMHELYSSLAALSDIIEDTHNEFWIKLQPGTILLIDNWRVLHGRAAFTGTRKMCGCYLTHDDWTSKARFLRLTA